MGKNIGDSKIVAKTINSGKYPKKNKYNKIVIES